MNRVRAQSEQSPSKVRAKSEQSPSRIENNVLVGLLGLSSDCSRTVLRLFSDCPQTVLGLSSDCFRTVLGLFGLCSDCSDSPRTARTVLGLHSDYVGECKVLQRMWPTSRSSVWWDVAWKTAVLAVLLVQQIEEVWWNLDFGTKKKLWNY